MINQLHIRLTPPFAIDVNICRPSDPTLEPLRVLIHDRHSLRRPASIAELPAVVARPFVEAGETRGDCPLENGLDGGHAGDDDEEIGFGDAPVDAWDVVVYFAISISMKEWS